MLLKVATAIKFWRSKFFISKSIFACVIWKAKVFFRLLNKISSASKSSSLPTPAKIFFVESIFLQGTFSNKNFLFTSKSAIFIFKFHLAKIFQRFYHKIFKLSNYVLFWQKKFHKNIFAEKIFSSIIICQQKLRPR